MNPARARLVVPLAWIATALVVLVAVCFGSGPGPAEALDVLAGRVRGLPTRASAAVVVWDLRLPRALLAALLGSALAVAGTITQGLFRNPMAEPGVLGISSGAAAVAVVAMYLGLDRLGLWVVPLMAAAGAAGVLLLLFALAGQSGRPSSTTLLLTGIAVAAFCSAFVSLVMTFEQSRWDLGIKVVRWLMGSFEGRSWGHLAGATLPCAVGLLGAYWLRNDLDALHLGDDTASSLGVDLRRFRFLAIASVAILVGTATAIPGVIAFVGLIVPHVARMLVGPSHRQLMPSSAALGALTLVAVDTLTRTVLPGDPPPGVITSFMGAPFFVWLLRRQGQGWSG